jgi:hypothetical protein
LKNNANVASERSELKLPNINAVNRDKTGLRIEGTVQ